MNSRSQMGKPKKQKLDGGEEMNEGCKSLSNLPDVLIGKILGLVPTKEAIRTSILSKRWEYLWTSVPNLDFTQAMLDKRTSLVNVVERALLLRGPADIKRFSLSFPVLSDASRVHSWISATVRRNVEVLSICLYGFKEPLKEPNLLPCSLFTSSTLKELELCLPCIFKVPCTVCFSSLRSLTLTLLVFSDDCSTQKLFSGCPVLEELTLQDCNWANLKFVSICAPKLLTLSINEMDLQYPRGSDGCQIMVFSGSLKDLSYVGRFQNDYCFYNLSSLTEAYICHNSTKSLRHLIYRFYKLLTALSSVRNLTICHTFFEDVQTNAPELLDYMPLFNDLTTLILESSPVDIRSKGLLRILQNCPCLQTMIFCEGISLSSEYAKDDGILEPWPPCFLSSLQVIEVNTFYGDLEEIHALEVLLKNAKVLEKMSITCSNNFQGAQEKKRDVNKQLSDVPKGSESCEIVLG
ncbi:putative F-box domain, FBD domain, leucine-rich repeat domain, L domain-containing protein [Rosa chinensis]|uniref:Putative F-box domain, FBD domain, leucine-rich repeat domain, L domain-containing protein n=2 Tax=Rosa chinensis TaxID=74649 RepID=A0A2P6QK14_ROSCH|nr:F-box/LRR-repeat protein At4g14103 isoform X1 [Rosa chinensis]PRQ34513.1 putative F-box domain, FBD domain, leucine-rich repeat domain, L domain-containing protein [Rosa chinensis]